MNRSVRVFVAVLVVSFAAFIFTACGGGGGGDNQPAEQATEPPAPAATATPAEAQAAAGDPAKGEELFMQTCSACHGPDAKGLPNLGKDLTNNKFIQGLSDDELLAFVKQGRPSGDPANTTGIDMPPKGGNPALTDEQILDIIAFLRTLQ